jgi:hypothetical protein
MMQDKTGSKRKKNEVNPSYAGQLKSADDFFGIEPAGGKNIHLHILAGLVMVIFAGWVWMLNPVPVIHGDQMNIVTMIETKQHPENFAKDTIWAGKAADSYPPLIRGIISFFISNWGIIGGHRVAQFPLSIAFLFIIYGSLYYLTRSVWASLITACCAIIWRWSMAETYYGLDRLQAVQPRSFVLVFIPLVFILVWKYRNSFLLVIPFFITGILFNLNPPESLDFAVLCWLALLYFALKNRGKLLILLFAGVAFIAGALPFVIQTIYVNHLVSPPFSPEQAQQYYQALQYRFSQIGFLPVPASKLVQPFYCFAPFIFIAALGWCIRKEKRNAFDKFLIVFAVLSFVGTVIGQAVLQQVYLSMKTYPFLDNFMRGQKFAYLVLYIYTAYLLADILRSAGLSAKALLITVCAVIVVLLPLFVNNSDDPFGQWEYNSAQLNQLLNGNKIEIAGWHQYVEGVSNWAKTNTPAESLFLFANNFMSPFRIYAQRSMVTTRDGGDFARFNKPDGFLRWSDYQAKLEKITAEGDLNGLLALAAESKADYIVVPPNWPDLKGRSLVYHDDYWKVFKSSRQ